VQNKLDDLFALIKFLRLEPFVDKAVWTEYIGSPVKFGQPIGFARLQAIMKVITLRRTKETRADNGQKILALPPRRDELRYLKFDANEQAIYNRFFEDSKAEFTELSRKNEVMKNYVGILQKILRLRQICDHYELVQESSSGLLAGQTYDDIAQAIAREGLTVERAAAIFAILRESASATCAECGSDLGTTAEALVDSTVDVEGGAPTPKRGRKSKAASSSSRANSPGPIRPILTRCQHLFCPQCYRASVFPGWPHVQPDMRGQCTACPCTLSASDAIEVAPDPAAVDGPAKKKGARKEKRQKGSATIDAFHASTKIRTLMSDLVTSSKANPNSVNYDPSSIEIQNVDENGNDVVDPPIKTIVFSQWTTMLDK
jgi:SWI/SNF-related matrix-associated actin-dependent regulator of chromatin subfamily A3